MRKIQYTLLILFTLTKVSVAQELSNVNIVADGSAPTKEKALTNALRNAIEKAFGAFISSSTKIENETLLYDQIASVAQGSIVSYDKIGEMRNPSSQEYTTTISALVSPGKIIAFTQSKGIEVAFKGSVFAQNALIEQYYKEQEPIILNHFIQSIDFKKIYKYTLSVNDPQLHSSQKRATDGFNYHSEYLHVTAAGIHNFRKDKFSNDEIFLLRQKSYEPEEPSIVESYDGKYYIPIQLFVEKTPYFDQVMNQYKKIVSKVAISLVEYIDVNGKIFGVGSLLTETYEKKWGDTYIEKNGKIFKVEPIETYEKKYGATYMPRNSILRTSSAFEGFEPIFRNPESAKLIEELKSKFQRAYEGEIILPYLESNIGKLSDYYFLTRIYNRGNIYIWKSYLDKDEDESAIILYNVGTLDDLQKITSIKFNLE